MPVVGIALREIEAKRLGVAMGNINVNNKTNIKDVVLNELPGLGKKGLTIKFSFNVEYTDGGNKKIGYIKIDGDALYFADNQEEIDKQWKKEKKLPDNINIETINAIIKKCLTKSLTVSEDLQLPPPISLPIARMREPEEVKEEKKK